MSMVKSSPTALNFGYDFVLLVHFRDTLYASILVCVVFHQSSPQFSIILTLKTDFVFIENVFFNSQVYYNAVKSETEGGNGEESNPGEWPWSVLIFRSPI